MSRSTPVAEVFRVTRHRGFLRHKEQVARVDAFTGQQFQSLRVAGLQPHWRVRFLHRHHGQTHIVVIVVFALEAENMVARKSGLQHRDGFIGPGAAVGEVGFERTEVMRQDARHQAQLQAPIEHLVQDSRFFGDAQRVVQRHDPAHGADLHAFGVHRGAGAENGRGRHQAFIGPEVVFHRESVVESKVVGEREFAPEKLVALAGCQRRLGPDVGEVTEFHGMLSRPAGLWRRE